MKQFCFLDFGEGEEDGSRSDLIGKFEIKYSFIRLQPDPSAAG